MHTSRDLIELAKQNLAARHGYTLPMSDYRFEKLTGFKQSTISRWTTGKNTIGTEFAARFAELCDLPGPYVLACLEHERAGAEIRPILEQIAEAFSGKAAAILAACALAFLGSISPTKPALALDSTAAPGFADTVYSVKSRRRRRLRERVRGWFRTLFPVSVLALAGCSGITSFEAAAGYNASAHMPWSRGETGGFDGGRDVVRFTLRHDFGRGFCSLSHISHLSTGWPVNNAREDWLDLAECGLRFTLSAPR